MFHDSFDREIKVGDYVLDKSRWLGRVVKMYETKTPGRRAYQKNRIQIVEGSKYDHSNAHVTTKKVPNYLTLVSPIGFPPAMVQAIDKKWKEEMDKNDE